MRVATGPGKIKERTPASTPASGRFALLYNFDIDDAQLKAEHQDWLSQNIVPILTRARASKVGLKGLASRSGANSYNMALSERRVDSAFNFLAGQGVRSEQLLRNFVGEEEAAALGRRDGTENEEDRAVGVYLDGIGMVTPHFTRQHWWNHRDGFDPRSSPVWTMVPANGRKVARIIDGAGWKLRSSVPNIVHFIDPDTNRRVDEFIVPSDDFEVVLEGIIPGSAHITADDVFGVSRRLLDVSVLAKKIVTVACHYVTDKAGHKTTRKPGDEKAMIDVVNDLFGPQANLEFQVVHSAAMTAKEDWGNPITYKEMGGEFLPLLRNYFKPAARIHVFYVWDYNPGAGDTDAEVDNIGGSGVIFEDNAGTDTGLSLAHEFGHDLGLPHRETRKELLMWPITDDRGGVLEKDQILTAHAKV